MNRKMGLFGKKVKPEEKLRAFQRSLRRSCREIERERVRLQNSEMKLKAEMKKLAARGETDSVMILAKDVSRNRTVMKKFLTLHSQLEGLGLRIQTIKAQSGVSAALKGAGAAMHQMNKMTNVGSIQKIMMQFMQENEMMDMKNEMIDDQMDDLWDDTGDVEEEAAMQLSNIFNEIGIPVPKQVSDAMSVNARAVSI